MRRRSVLTIVVFLCFVLGTGCFVYADPAQQTEAEPAGSSDLKVTTDEVKPADPIGAVQKLKVSKKTYNSVTLKWARNAKATGYEVFRSKGNKKNFKLIKSITGADTVTWKNTKLRDNTVYYYKVKATNGTTFSAIVTAKTPKATFEQSSTVVTVSAYRDGTNISWNKLDGVDGYRVFRAYPGGKYKQIKQVNSTVTTFFDNKADSGVKCYYKVRGYKGLILKKFTALSAAKAITTVTRVYIACGHGTDILGAWDTGCTYKSLTEAGLMMPITKSFVNYTRKSGVFVYTDVDTGNDKNMIACVREANKHPLSAYVSVHCDWYKAPTGTLPLYNSSRGKALASSLNAGVRSQVTIATRGLSRRPDLYELTQTDMPACIFETGSIKYDNTTFRQKYTLYGKGLAKGLCSYLGVKFAG